MVATFDIAVAGAGIGGLGFAALAAQAGHRVVVFDRFDTPLPVGSGLVVQPVGQAVLDAIGALDAARALGQPITDMRGTEARHGREVLNVSYGARPGLAMHRASLFHVLLGAAQDAGATLISGAEVTGRDDRHLLVGARREGPFDLIVDAAGAGSVLSPLRARPLGYGAIWGNVPWPSQTDLPPNGLRQRYRRADRMLGVLPIGRLPDDPTPLAAVFWSLRRGDHAAWRATPLDAWKDEARSLWPAMAPFLDPITQHDAMTMARYSHGTLRNPADEGVAHIGDAAHRASPQLGQGANMALLDAHALARALRRGSVDEALWAYARARRGHVWLYQAISAVFTPQYQSDSHILPWARDRVLVPLTRLPGMGQVLTRLVAGDLVPPLGSLDLRATG